MKVISISKGGLELARTQLNRRLKTIGRSPACDVVLRAPGVSQVHFLLEWIGEGVFDPALGRWSIFNVSGRDKDGGEGIIVESTVNFQAFQFQILDDRLESRSDMGGTIQASLSKGMGKNMSSRGSEILELVQTRFESGAIEEVRHISRKRGLRRLNRPLSRVREFKVQWNPKGSEKPLLSIILEEMPGAEIYRKGQRLDFHKSPGLTANDFLEIRWCGYRFFLRFVQPLSSIPAVQLGLLRERLLNLLFSFGLLLGLCLSGVMILAQRHPKQDETIPPPPRIAKLEIKQVAPAAPFEKTPPPQSEPEAAGLKANKATPPPKPSKAAAPRFKNTIPRAKPKMGLNSPAPVTDVNTIGILGALRKSKDTSPGVRADQIINNGIVTESVSGKEGKVVLQNSPSGTINTDVGGSQSGDGTNLSAASTTLSGNREYDPKSVGPIARKGGKSGYSLGTGLSGSGKDIQMGDLQGKADLGGMQVSGGLSRDQVRQEIQKHRGEIRTCYERALLSNPKLAGRINYGWNISPKGPVVSAQVEKSEAKSAALESCILEVIRSMNFPASPNGKPTAVHYPFIFQAQ